MSHSAMFLEGLQNNSSILRTIATSAATARGWQVEFSPGVTSCPHLRKHLRDPSQAQSCLTGSRHTFMSRCESPLGQPSSLSVLVSFPVAMIECSVKIILRQKVYPSPRGQISVPHRREVKASGVQSKWLGEQRMRVCAFGSLLRLSKRVYFLFIYVYVYVLNSWRPEMDIESPAAGGTGTCELPHLGAGS